MTTTEIAANTKTRKRLDIGFLTMKLMTGLPRFACIPQFQYDCERSAVAVMTDAGRIMLGGQSWEGLPTDDNLLNMDRIGDQMFNLLSELSRVTSRNGSYFDYNNIEKSLAAIRTVRDTFEGGPTKFDETVRMVIGSRVFVRSLTFYTAFPSSRMPDDIRAQVAAAVKTEVYEQVHIAWEATWTEALRLTIGAERRQLDAPLDPIAFAKDKRDGKYYILGTWDLTKLESYIVSEFTEAA